MYDITEIQGHLGLFADHLMLIKVKYLDSGVKHSDYFGKKNIWTKS
jgi:hypothetical protein